MRARYLVAEPAAQRTRERDRIWAVSEDLLGVSNFEDISSDGSWRWIYIEAFGDVLASSARGNITLGIDIPADTWPVSVDLSELELALVSPPTRSNISAIGCRRWGDGAPRCK